MGKISLSAILAFTVMLMMSFFPVQVFASDDENEGIIVYSDFEAGSFEGWTSFGNKSSISITNERSYTGSHCIVTGNREIEWSGPSLNIVDFVIPESVIKIKAYVMNASEENAIIKLSLKMIGNDGVESYDTLSSVNSTNSNWDLLEGEYTVPSDLANLNVYLETESGLSDFYVDSVTIIGRQDNIKAEANEAGDYYFGFEDDLGGWVPRGDMSVTLTNKFSCEGQYSLYASGRKELWNTPSVRLTGIRKGKDYSYTAFAMFRSKEINSHVFKLKLQYDMEGREIYETIASKEIQSGSWSKITGHFTLPEDALNVLFYVIPDNTDQFTDSSGEYLSYYVDRVEIIDDTILNARKRTRRIIFGTVYGLIAVIVIVLIIYIVKKSGKNKAVIKSSRTDSMTNALNRNAYESDIKSFESPEKLKKIYITVCDLNYLKQINDNYGHEMGDKAIIRCAAVLLKAVSRHGKVYRIGGDEFLCITETDQSALIIEEFLLESGKYKGYPFSVAVGSAHYEKEIDGSKPSFKTIIARADKEMYINKEKVKAETPGF